MLQPELHHAITNVLDTKITGTVPLSGGDINLVCKVDTTKDSYVLKTNNDSNALKIFQAERLGLETLASSETFKIPKVISIGKENETAFLLMEYIKPGNTSENYNNEFGKLLALMHQTTAGEFGFEQDNFIGTLPQYNTTKQSAADFYIEMRLLPQLKTATERGYSFNIGKLFSNLSGLIPEEKPALVHGDLWSGNAITNSNGMPCLIDPAVFYGHRETDIAMMMLFGGYSTKIFECYQWYYPLSPGWKERLEIWQLYYLLVHLNLFGSSYYGSVKNSIHKYN